MKKLKLKFSLKALFSGPCLAFQINLCQVKTDQLTGKCVPTQIPAPPQSGFWYYHQIIGGLTLSLQLKEKL